MKTVLASISEPDMGGVSTIRVTVAVEETDPTLPSSLISTFTGSLLTLQMGVVIV
jgi:hypothetical protein